MCNSCEDIHGDIIFDNGRQRARAHVTLLKIDILSFMAKGTSYLEKKFDDILSSGIRDMTYNSIGDLVTLEVKVMGQGH